MPVIKYLIYAHNIKISEKEKTEIESNLNLKIRNQSKLKKEQFDKTESGIYFIDDLSIYANIQKYNILELFIFVENNFLVKFFEESLNNSNKAKVFGVNTESEIKTILHKYSLFRLSDDYIHANYIKLCHALNFKATCLSRSVSAILVKNNEIISTSANVNFIESERCLEKECTFCIKKSAIKSECICIHAETNLLLKTKGIIDESCILYVSTFPCQNCTLSIIFSKIKKVYFGEFFKKKFLKFSLEYFRKANVEVFYVKKMRVGFSVIKIT